MFRYKVILVNLKSLIRSFSVQAQNTNVTSVDKLMLIVHATGNLAIKVTLESQLSLSLHDLVHKERIMALPGNTIYCPLLRLLNINGLQYVTDY